MGFTSPYNSREIFTQQHWHATFYSFVWSVWGKWMKMGNKKNQGRKYTPKKKAYYGPKKTVEPSTAEEMGAGDAAAASSSASSRKLMELTNLLDNDEPDFSLSSDSSSTDSSCTDAESEDTDSAAALSATGNRLVSLILLQSAIAMMCACSSCKSGTIDLIEKSRQGLGSFLVLKCSNMECQEEHEIPSCKKTQFFDVNRRSVLAVWRIGHGHAGLKKFCGIMDLPPPISEANFRRHQRAMLAASQKVAVDSMETAAEELRKDNPDGEVAVTFDGTWQRRGFSSLFGVFVCISWLTGRVLDFCVSSKYCATCSSWNWKLERGKASKDEHGQWMTDHAQSCSVTTQRSSPGMESEAARTLWVRSEERCHLKYLTFIGDGDSKGFNEVCQANPYGDEKVQKEECVGHVQKRLGKALRDLKKSKKGWEVGRRRWYQWPWTPYWQNDWYPADLLWNGYSGTFHWLASYGQSNLGWPSSPLLHWRHSPAPVLSGWLPILVRLQEGCCWSPGQLWAPQHPT